MGRPARVPRAAADRDKADRHKANRIGDAAPRRRATATPTDGRLALVEGPANSRMFVYLAGNWLHRIERERRALYFGDLDLAMVAEVIGTAGVEPGMRDAAFRQKHKDFAGAIPVEEMRAVNAASTGTTLVITIALAAIAVLVGAILWWHRKLD